MEDTDIIGESLNNVLRACQQRLPEKDLLAFGALKTDFKRLEFALKQDFVHEIIDFEAGFEGKCLEKAKEFKADGNKFFGKKSYASALDSYNKAVLQVPMYDESGERSEDLSVMIANRWGQPVWAGMGGSGGGVGWGWSDVRGVFYWHILYTSIKVIAQISNYNQTKQWDVITHACP